MIRGFIGLGSNVGDRLANLVASVAALSAKGVEVVRVSSIYETDPVGPPQDDFLNAAVAVNTELSAQELIATLKSVEQELGREEAPRWGPRVIDLDLLLFGDQTIDEPGLTVPHAELTNRAFALIPVLELDPDLELPSGEPHPRRVPLAKGAVRLVAPARELLGDAIAGDG